MAPTVALPSLTIPRIVDTTLRRIASMLRQMTSVWQTVGPATAAPSLMDDADRYEPPVIVPAVLLKVVEIAVTIRGTEMARPATIKPTRTAYSTAVGPSSLVRKFRTLLIVELIISLLLHEAQSPRTDSS
jgi:sirohydrochlorin ferrochelatase